MELHADAPTTTNPLERWSGRRVARLSPIDICGEGSQAVSELKVISGPPAALREELAGRVRELRTADPLSPITVLVGTSLQRPFLQRWLAARLGAHANVRILMPGDLALLLGAAPLVAAGRRALPPLADRVLLADVARKHPGYFAPVAETPGFGEALFRLVRELRGAGYDLSDLGPLLDGATDAPEKAGSLAGDPVRVRAAPLGLLRPGRRAAGGRPGSPRRAGAARLGDARHAAGARAAARGIAERMPVDVYLADLPAAADAPFAELRARLLAGGAAERQVAELGGARARRSTVCARSMFTAPAKPAIEADGTLRLVSAPDPSREVRAAARACLEWAREGVPFWDMAVAYRHGEAYLPLAEAVFVEAGIPVYLHEGSPLAERPIGRQTLGLLALFDGELSRQSVMDFLTDARFPEALHDEYGGIPASRWDSLSRDAGIVEGRRAVAAQRLGAVQRPTATTSSAAGLGARSVSRTPAGSRGSSPSWTAGCASGRRGRTWAEHLDYLQGLLARYVEGADEVIVRAARTRAVHRAGGGGRLRLVPRRRRARDRDAALRGCDRQPAGGVRRARRERRRGQLAARGSSSRACGSSARPSGRSRRRRARTRSCSTTSATKISERAPAPLAPRVGARQRGGADLRARVRGGARAAGRLLRAPRDRGEPTAAAVGVLPRARLAARGRARVGRRGAAAAAATTCERIPGDAIGAPIRRRPLRARPGRRSALPRPSAVSEPERDRTYLQARVTRPLAVATFERAAAVVRARARGRARAAFADRYSDWDGALGPDALDAIATLLPARSRRSSPTSLEGYATCPQRFLLERLLRVSAVEEPERTVRIDTLQPRQRVPPDLRALLRANGTARDRRRSPRRPSERMRAIAGEECDAAPGARRDRLSGDVGGRPARGDRGLRALARESSARTSSRARCRWSRCEARFGQRIAGEKQTASLSRDEPIEIELAARARSSAGRIDRVNWDEARRRVPRGRLQERRKVRDEKPGELQGGRMLQLPLYVLAGVEAARDRPDRRRGRVRVPDAPGEFHVVDWTPRGLADATTT